MEHVPKYFSAEDAEHITKEVGQIEAAHVFIDPKGEEAITVFGEEKPDEAKLEEEFLEKHGIEPEEYIANRKDSSFSPFVRHKNQSDAAEKMIKNEASTKAKNSKRMQSGESYFDQNMMRGH